MTVCIKYFFLLKFFKNMIYYELEVFMKIIIVGAGKVGEYLFTDLNTEDNDIILIEKRQERRQIGRASCRERV